MPRLSKSAIKGLISLVLVRVLGSTSMAGFFRRDPTAGYPADQPNIIRVIDDFRTQWQSPRPTLRVGQDRRHATKHYAHFHRQ